MSFATWINNVEIIKWTKLIVDEVKELIIIFIILAVKRTSTLMGNCPNHWLLNEEEVPALYMNSSCRWEHVMIGWMGLFLLNHHYKIISLLLLILYEVIFYKAFLALQSLILTSFFYPYKISVQSIFKMYLKQPVLQFLLVWHQGLMDWFHYRCSLFCLSFILIWS